MIHKIFIVSLFFVIAAIAQSPDSYEPNNDFSSAYPVFLGDSVVRNAFVFGVDRLKPDSSNFDIDYYKVKLEAGKLLIFSQFSDDTNCYNLNSLLHIELYDSSKSLLFSDEIFGCGSYKYGVTQTGTYYLKIKASDYRELSSVHYGFSIHQRDNKSLFTIISPNGGERFSAGQVVKLQWEADSIISEDGSMTVDMQYSIDSGKSWENLLFDSIPPSSGYLWKVPHLKHGTDRALFKVFARFITNPPSDVSDKPFTILASSNDTYEPNDNFASATAIEVGDSVVKNAVVINSLGYPDSTLDDTALTDVDFFKINLTAGKMVTISGMSVSNQYYWEPNDNGYFRSSPVLIRLYDASKNQLGINYGALSYTIAQSGVYYCEISIDEKSYYSNEYCLSISLNDPITLISPNGGENFQTGQKVTVRWTGDSLNGYLSLCYSLNNGTSWSIVENSKGVDSFIWSVPPLKKRTDQVLFKVAASTQFDISNGTFTIQAAPMDVYEPNNDKSTAYPIAVGDSVVKNASAYLCEEDTTGLNYSPTDCLMDIDYYKVNLKVGSLVRVRFWSPDSKGDGTVVANEFYNDFQPLSPIYTPYGANSDDRFYNITDTGVHYIKVWQGHQKYGLSIESVAILMTEKSILDTNAIQYDMSYGCYRTQVSAHLTNMSFNLLLIEKSQNWISSMVLAPNDFAPLPNEVAKVKAFAVNFFHRINLPLAEDITIPYGPSELNGYPEKSLAVVCQDQSTDDKWYPVASSIDTVKHQIVIHMPKLDFHFFQVYVKSDSTLASRFANISPAFGIKTDFIYKKQNVVVYLSLPNTVKTELRLYDIQGKCVRKGGFTAVVGSSTLQWNLGGLANGKYILSIRAGQYNLKGSILIMN